LKDKPGKNNELDQTIKEAFKSRNACQQNAASDRQLHGNEAIVGKT
jgi:hypothetical protein